MKNIFCFFGLHKYESIDWKSDFLSSTRSNLEIDYETSPISFKTITFRLNLRIDKCKNCGKIRQVRDKRAEAIKQLKIQAWKERRFVIIEKHKNPKRYIVKTTFKGIDLDTYELTIWDEDIERRKKEYKQICINNNKDENTLILFCLDDKNVNIPHELL